MKILFLYVDPYNSTGIPIGLSYLISILKNKGHEISLFETTFYKFDYSEFNITGLIDEKGDIIISDFKEKVANLNPKLIGITCTSLCLKFSVKLLESLDENRPLTIFGGVGATVDYMNLIKANVVDYICVGLGEECLQKLIICLEGNIDYSEIPNLIYKDNGKVVKNKFSQSIDLTNLPPPDWSLFDKRHFERIFKGKIMRWGNFQLTRGCYYNCSYCVNAYYHKELNMNPYKFPVEKIIEEFKLLSKKFNLEIIRIFDECFGLGDLSYYENFSELYKNEIRLPTIIETRPETITPKTIKILKNLNTISVSMGIEASNEEQRRLMLNRRVSNDTIRKAFNLLKKENIRSSSYNIIGFPHDTREKIFETIKLNRECKPDFINVFLFSPFPKTKLRDYCLKIDLLETTAIINYLSRSIIKNEMLLKDELYGLFRTFKYYIKLPEYLYPLIERAERFDEIGDSILELLEKVVILKNGY